MATPSEDAMRRWSAAIREIEVLEPWLTESHWDESYWDAVATKIVELVGEHPTHAAARTALEAALTTTFEAKLESDNGLFRDNLERRLDLIVGLALDPS